MSKPQHERLTRINSRDGRLLMAGHFAEELVAIAGGSPCYIYDRDAMTERVLALRAVMPEDLQLHYAMKANPMPSVVDHMAALVDGLDVASQGELQVALASGMDCEHISFAGPAKQSRELFAAVAAGITVNVESPTELARLEEAAAQLAKKARVAIRVNPDFELKTSGMKMGGGPKQFGIDAEEVPALLAGLNSEWLDFQGFHIFAGSQNLQADAVIDAHNKTFALAERLAAASPVALRHVNIGGGLGIPYFPGEPAIELASIADNLARLMANRSADWAGAEIVMELGRYLVGEAGYYICQVTDRKLSRGQVYLMTDGGLHHHLSNSGNFGQVIRKNYPVVLADKLADVATETAELAGPLCTPLDVVAAKLELPVAAIGDYVVVLQSGAYGASASPQAFLSHPAAVELLI